MKLICPKCGRSHEPSPGTPPATCQSCGTPLKPQPQEPLELAGESPAAGITCPNCGKWIEPGAQICTACGYSRRLARTLTTRVGTPEVFKQPSKSPSPETPEIEAERAYRRAKERQRIGKGDGLRLLVAIVCLLTLGAFVMAAPTTSLTQNIPVKLPALLQPPKFDALNASFTMLMFLVVAVPIMGLGVRIGAAITHIEIATRFSWLRTAGVVAAVLLATEIVFSTDQITLHWPRPLGMLALAAAAGITLLLFTWYLHDVNFSAALVLSIVTVISAAAGLIAAAAAYAWVGNRVGIGPVIKPINAWTWGLRGP